jgi:hypothetical protein
MAFVSRAERKLGFGMDSAAVVGPGAYFADTGVKKQSTGAPFSSTTLRKFEGTHSFAPGPGAYDRSDSFVKPSLYDQFGQERSTSQFARANRFKHKPRTSVPGPGKYEVTSSLGRMSTVKPKKDRQAVQWLRQPSAPSIPGPTHKYGYEELPSGELVMQVGSEVHHSGLKTNSIGPGHYREVKVKSQKGTSWHKYKAKRDLDAKVTQSHLGPGAYYDGRSGYAQRKSKETSAFASASKRDCYIPEPGQREEDREEVPGPGQYNVNNSFSTYAARPEIQHFFGSSAARFKANRFESSSVGPGKYLEISTPIAARKPGDSKTPFASSTSRFEAKIESALGPGSYREDSLVDKVIKKVSGRIGTFGSTKRMSHDESSESNPGPGYYSSDTGRQRSVLLNKPGSVFMSKVKRDQQPRNKDIPPPGAYEGALIRPSEPRDQPEAPFKATPRRFKEALVDKLGPGYYSPQTLSKPAYTETGFIAREPRFKPAKVEEKPGPWTYREDTEGEWRKPSFNVLFSEAK